MMNGKIILMLEMICIILLTLYRLFMTKYKNVTANFWKRNYVMFACCAY